MFRSNHRYLRRAAPFHRGRHFRDIHSAWKPRPRSNQFQATPEENTPEEATATAHSAVKNMKRRRMPRLAASSAEERKRYRNERHTRQGPLCYTVSVTLMTMRPLLKSMRLNPGRVDLDLIESVTPLLERLESILQTCGSCPLLDNATARLCH